MKNAGISGYNHAFWVEFFHYPLFVQLVTSRENHPHCELSLPDFPFLGGKGVVNPTPENGHRNQPDLDDQILRKNTLVIFYWLLNG